MVKNMPTGILKFLANPGIGNLLLLLGAVIGVGGSYWVHLRRLENRKKATRTALKAELSSMTFLDRWIDDMDAIPQQRVLVTSAYEANAEYIGLLTDEEVEKITSFYSQAILINDMVEINRDIKLKTELKENTIDQGKISREDVLSDRFNHCAIARWQSLQLIRRDLGEEHRDPNEMSMPQSAGETISEKHPFIQSNKELLISKNYFEHTTGNPNLLKLTKEGENWLEENAGGKPGL